MIKIPSPSSLLSDRFRGFLPVVVDVETGGFNPQTDALLEIAAITLKMDDNGFLSTDKIFQKNIIPFTGANLEESSLVFTGIDPFHTEREAVTEREALTEIFTEIRIAKKEQQCKRAILVGHNAHFDLSFLNAAIRRANIKRNPFHQFSCLDTVSLSALALGETVLAHACQAIDIDFNSKQAHSADYDALKTAELFCSIVNTWNQLFIS